MKIRALCFGLLAMGMLVLAQASPASAAVSCNGASSVPRVGAIYVGSGASCVLGAADSPTYISVASGGSLRLENAKATQVAAMGSVTIANSIVSGSVTLSGIANGSSRICGSIIGGYLLVSNNLSPVNVAPTEACPISNFVAQGVFVMNNKAQVFMHALSVFGPIYCLGNTPPTVLWAATTLPPGQFYVQCAR
jgi:hypothetical protein